MAVFLSQQEEERRNMLDLSKIKAFVFDVDGVFTDGGVLSMPDGDLLRTFDAKDCFAVRTAVNNGYIAAFLTGGVSQSLIYRALSLGIERDDIYMLAKNKIDPFMKFCKKYNLDPQEVAYFGDDIPDIEVLKICGISVCPSDAVQQVKEVCKYISPNPGGKRCVREFIERVLTLHGKWIFNPTEPWKGEHPEHIVKVKESL